MPIRSPRGPEKGTAPTTQRPGPGEEQPPPAAAIPSFASLRDPRRHTAVDVLLPAAPSAPRAPAEPAPPPPSSPRPADYADLLHFGARLAGAALTLPVRIVAWPLRRPARCLRRLLG